MDKRNILVFPCGSEVALEVHRSLEHSIHFELFGGSSVEDHGVFVFKNYIGDIPFIDSPEFISSLREIVLDKQIDAIYPALDSVISVLKTNEESLGCKVIAPDPLTTEICLSKSLTYKALENVVRVPKMYTVECSFNYPIFKKPDKGYGSRGAHIVTSEEDLKYHISKDPEAVLLEYLPGKEYTIDCFTNSKGELLFVGPRERKRISNGISVNTKTLQLSNQFKQFAEQINSTLRFNGAWFFQLKESINNELVLLEVAARFGGSSGIFRAKGVNFSILTLFNAFGLPVTIELNENEVEMDRALNNLYRLNINFQHAYIDLDDTLILNGSVNSTLVSLIFKLLNEKKSIRLITKHTGDLSATLRKYRIDNLFDEVIHLNQRMNKWEYIKYKNSIFIDDSFAERMDVKRRLGIPVFGTDMIDALNSSI